MGKAHMNPAEVLQAFTELKARQLMIVHWGTFRLGDEPVYLPPDDMRRVMATAERGEALIHLDHGETLFYG
jgi:L-ascorbate metabolism protein UlaG (beta-lactamase superfamily)